MPNCLLEPIPELFQAAKYLNEGLTAHLNGEFENAEDLFKLANMNEIREWTESIWGVGGIFTGFQRKLGNPETLQKDQRDFIRMPDKNGEKELLNRDGHFCRFCGIPVVRKEVRVALNKIYPNAIPWGRRNPEQHAAFQALWVQYDHLLPHARGGKTELANMVITCAPCNYGRMNFLIEEVGLALPIIQEPPVPRWDGMERLFK